MLGWLTAFFTLRLAAMIGRHVLTAGRIFNTSSSECCLNRRQCDRHRGFAGSKERWPFYTAAERQTRLFSEVMSGPERSFPAKRQGGGEVLDRLFYEGQFPEKEEPLGYHGALFPIPH